MGLHEPMSAQIPESVLHMPLHGEGSEKSGDARDERKSLIINGGQGRN